MHACIHGKGTAGLVGILRGIKTVWKWLSPYRLKEARGPGNIASAGTFSSDTGSMLPDYTGCNSFL